MHEYFVPIVTELMEDGWFGIVDSAITLNVEKITSQQDAISLKEVTGPTVSVSATDRHLSPEGFEMSDAEWCEGFLLASKHAALNP